MNGKYVYVFTMNGVKSSSFSYIYISPFHITVATVIFNKYASSSKVTYGIHALTV